MIDASELDAAVEAVYRRIVADYAPERIVLVPAYLDESEAKADIDLLIVKDSKEEFEQRRERVLRMAAPAAPGLKVDALVLTPAELERRQKLGDYLLQEILLHGRVLYPEVGSD